MENWLDKKRRIIQCEINYLKVNENEHAFQFNLRDDFPECALSRHQLTAKHIHKDVNVSSNELFDFNMPVKSNALRIGYQQKVIN